MSDRPVVIVDPFSSGVELAPAFAKRGHPAFAVLSSERIAVESIRRDDFIQVYQYTPRLVDELRSLNPLCVLPGAEDGVEVADILANELTPGRANDIGLSAARRDKGLMQDAVSKAGLPVIRGIRTDSVNEVAEWLSAKALTSSPLVVKPARSKGTDNVHYVHPGGVWNAPFEKILDVTNLLGEKNEQVMVQEYVTGTEYSVDTVSCGGTHTLCNIQRYAKVTSNGRMAMWDHAEFVPFDRAEHGEMVAYAYDVLAALGIRWGAAHTEIMATADGPRLIEVGARMCGGPQPTFARVATGSSQVERLVETFVDGRVLSGDYQHLKCVIPIFLRTPKSGRLQNVEVFDQLSSLSTHYGTYISHRNGDYVKQTVDFVSILGIVTLAGDDPDVVLSECAQVRMIEGQLSIA